uniref:Uncharacterized protein n=2 Tax=Physcomitrium patens TaxID=3218 RepID=A0A2K1KMC3_PHYPA|nr:hypothetical protein PHYPA_005810 [Physcomitrium patens]
MALKVSCSKICKPIEDHCFILIGGTIIWQSKRQQTISKSFIKSKYMSLLTGTTKTI